MKSKVFDEFWIEHTPVLTRLVKAIQEDITDDSRCSDDSEDSEPGITITISCNEDCSEWSYQTGDNSYTGSCYMHPYWGVGYIYRDSKPEKVARELVEDLGEQIQDWEEN